MTQTNWQGPRISEIAAAAGLSTATVDRVVNGRGGVSAARCEAVWHAIAQLRRAPHHPPAPLRIALRCISGQSFNDTLTAACQQFTAANPDVEIDAQTSLTQDTSPLAFAAGLSAIKDGTGGVLLVGWEHPAINNAVRGLIARGIPVVCLTTDLPGSGRTAYAGINQLKAGCSAGYLMGRLIRAPHGVVSVFASAPFSCQEDRETGFRRVIRTEFPHLTVAENIGSHDDPAVSKAAAAKLLASSNPPAGIYNVAGANTGIAEAIQESGRACVFIGHELTKNSRRLLEAGLMDFVIAHDPGVELSQAVDIIRMASGNAATPLEDRVTAPLLITKYGF